MRDDDDDDEGKDEGAAVVTTVLNVVGVVIMVVRLTSVGSPGSEPAGGFVGSTTVVVGATVGVLPWGSSCEEAEGADALGIGGVGGGDEAVVGRTVTVAGGTGAGVTVTVRAGPVMSTTEMEMVVGTDSVTVFGSGVLVTVRVVAMTVTSLTVGSPSPWSGCSSSGSRGTIEYFGFLESGGDARRGSTAG